MSDEIMGSELKVRFVIDLRRTSFNVYRLFGRAFLFLDFIDFTSAVSFRLGLPIFGRVTAAFAGISHKETLPIVRFSAPRILP
jgi:hypothetical protein